MIWYTVMKTATEYDGVNITPFTKRYSVLRAEMVRDIEALRVKGLTYKEIGELLGMKRTSVNNFLKGYQVRK